MITNRMLVLLKITIESAFQAWDSLLKNKLRTILSLLGITIGIFCIIVVKSAVDSLQENIVEAFNELGSDIIYVDTRPWNEDPGMNYWKYVNFPRPGLDEFQAINKKSKLAQGASLAVFSGGEAIKHLNNSVSNIFIMGISFEYDQVNSLDIEKGRYFSRIEYDNASNKVILGGKVAKSLFGTIEPINKMVRLYGQDFQVIGVLKDEGENMFNFINFDNVVLLSLKNASKFINVSNKFSDNRLLAVKAKKNVDLTELKAEIAGIIRSERKLKPLEKDNFSLNEVSLLTNLISSVFGVINIAGFMIGIFSLIVGMFSVANIMFVSVKERTSQIGIKKALGARRFIILTEFLIESVILCLIGGAIGLLLVYLTLKLGSQLTTFNMSLSVVNVFIGVGTSILVGIISGYIPAFQASRMDPVEAMRS